VGSHHAEPDGARRHVLVLLPERARRPYLVEALHHRLANRPIRHRPWYALQFTSTALTVHSIRLLRLVHVLHQHLLHRLAQSWLLRGRGVRRHRGHLHPVIVPAALHQLLPGNVPQAGGGHQEARAGDVGAARDGG